MRWSKPTCWEKWNSKWLKLGMGSVWPKHYSISIGLNVHNSRLFWFTAIKHLVHTDWFLVQAPMYFHLHVGFLLGVYWRVKRLNCLSAPEKWKYVSGRRVAAEQTASFGFSLGSSVALSRCTVQELYFLIRESNVTSYPEKSWACQTHKHIPATHASS